MTHFLHRKLDSNLPIAARGEGCYIFDTTGKRYLDASGGAAVACLGHSHPAVIEAVIQQIKTLPSAHTSFFTTEPSEALADYLVSRAPEGISRFLTVSDGSVAVETALKLARQYWIERGKPERKMIISRRQSYHGNTLGALSVGGNERRRAPYSPLLSDCVTFIDPCFEYRFKHDGESSEEYGLRAANLLEMEILALGPDNVGAFIAETVVGATTGCVAAAPGYFKRIREICDKYEVLLILDEIMSGMGRTGTLFACEQEGITPDIATVAKGLGGGYQPIGGVFASKKVMDALEAGSNALANGHTYMGHSVACAAALAVQKVIEQDGLLDRVQTLGKQFEQKLISRFGDHPHVGDIRGRGFFWALELVADRNTKETFEPKQKLNELIKTEAQDRGMACYPSGGTADGVRGDHILFAPPYIITESQLDDIVDITAESLNAALSAINKKA
ncbi:aspartate aminotransferase family protein [Pseudomonas azerbaijanoccidentalis]